MSCTQVWSQIPRRNWQTHSFPAYAAAGMPLSVARALPAAAGERPRDQAADRQRALPPGAFAVAVADRAQADDRAGRGGDALVVRAPPEHRRARGLPRDRPWLGVRAHALDPADALARGH